MAHPAGWLGTIHTEKVEGSNLFLLSKMPSQTPDILDGETIKLKRRAMQCYKGLVLANRFAPKHSPVMLSGGRHDGKIDVWSQDNYARVLPSFVRDPPAAVTLADLQVAARLAEQIAALESTPFDGGHWRLFRILYLYLRAREIGDPMDRLHQYCRCIDGLITAST